MLDANGHLWIIEINTNPSIELSNKWLKALIPRMLDDAFKLTIDRIFPKGRDIKEEANAVFSVDGYSNNENLWEFMELKTEPEENMSLWFDLYLYDKLCHIYLKIAYPKK